MNSVLFSMHINIILIIIITAVIHLLCLLSLHQAAVFVEEDPILLDKPRIKQAAPAEGANDLSRRQDSKLDIDQLA